MPQKRPRLKRNSLQHVIRNNPSAVLIKIFHKLLSFYGPRNWWPAKTRFEVIVGAILTQNVSWKNAKIAVVVLKKAGCLTPQAIFRSPHNKIAKLIYSSRFYNQKTEKLKAFCRYLLNKYSGSLDRMFSVDTDILREELLSIKGIGRETADSIILYAGNKPSFVSDAYTKRFMDRYGLFKNLDVYEEIRSFFMANLPKDVHLYNEFHALIVHHGYKVCKAEPTCDECPVRSISRDLYCKLGVREGSS